MCDKCFRNEISSFRTKEEYLDFDLELTKKLANEKTIKYIQFVKTSEIRIDSRDYEDLGYNVFECLHCGQLWGLRDPEYSDFGYFKKINQQTIENDIKALKKKTRKASFSLSRFFGKGKNFGCIISTIFIIIALALIFFLNK